MKCQPHQLTKNFSLEDFDTTKILGTDMSSYKTFEFYFVKRSLNAAGLKPQ